MSVLTRTAILICTAAALLGADTLTLRSGETIRGTFVGGTARQVRMELNGEIRTYDVGQVQSVVFDDQTYSPPPQATRDRDRDRDRAQSNYPPPRDQAPPYAAGITIPADTEVRIRMIDSVNSDTARLGETFRASLDEPVYVNGQQVIPRGADVMTRLVEDQQSGRIQGRTVLTLALLSITVDGRPIDVTSTDVRTESGSRGARSGEVIGGTAALGAIIGAIAGGGKGAAIGAGSGAAVGTGVQVMTSGQRVRIPSETRLSFRLQYPVQL